MKRWLLVAATVLVAVVGVWLVGRKPVPKASPGAEAPPAWGGACRKAGGGFAGWGWSTEADTGRAVERAVGAALDRAPAGPELVFVHYSNQHSPERILQALRAATGSNTRVCGWSSHEGVVTPDGYHLSPNGAVGVLPLGLSGLRAGVGCAGFDEADEPGKCAKLALRRAAEDAGAGRGSSPSAIILSATYHGHEEVILAALDAVTGGHVPVLGGTAAGDPTAKQYNGSVLGGKRAVRKGLVLCALYSDRPVGWSFQGGFDRTGKSGVVTATAAKGRAILQIDNRPALEVYDEWSGGRIGDAMRAGLDMSKFCGLYPLCRRLTSGEGRDHNLFVHSWPMSDGAKAGWLVTSATVSPGDAVYFSEGSWNILLNRIGVLGQQARRSQPELRPAAGLFICCEGVLKNIPPAQRDQMAYLMNRSLGDVPWIGSFTWGEEGNFPGCGNYHGNLTTSLTLFPAPPGGGG